MKLTFLGVGSAFTLPNRALGQTLEDCDWQSNALIEADNGKKVLIDCGSDIRFALWQQQLGYKDIAAVYGSHCHADHLGGMEWLAFCRYFDKSAGPHPIFYSERTLMNEIWNNSLKGGLNCIEGQVMHLEDYFECRPFDINDHFIWEGIKFIPFQTVHVMAGSAIKHSYGLEIECPSRNAEVVKILFTTDSQFCPSQIDVFYRRNQYIFQDCETSKYPSRVHAHFNFLKGLDAEIKSRMVLYHYQPNPDQDAIAEGFKGFAKKGQCFEF
jgi:ribonuclease BN (tRNA processing enzyme)